MIPSWSNQLSGKSWVNTIGYPGQIVELTQELEELLPIGTREVCAETGFDGEYATCRAFSKSSLPFGVRVTA